MNTRGVPERDIPVGRVCAVDGRWGRECEWGVDRKQVSTIANRRILHAMVLESASVPNRSVSTLAGNKKIPNCQSVNRDLINF